MFKLLDDNTSRTYCRNLSREELNIDEMQDMIDEQMHDRDAKSWRPSSSRNSPSMMTSPGHRDTGTFKT